MHNGVTDYTQIRRCVMKFCQIDKITRRTRIFDDNVTDYTQIHRCVLKFCQIEGFQ